MIDSKSLLRIIEAMTANLGQDAPGLALIPMAPDMAVTLLRCVVMTQDFLENSTANVDCREPLVAVLAARDMLESLLQMDGDELFAPGEPRTMN